MHMRFEKDGLRNYLLIPLLHGNNKQFSPYIIFKQLEISLYVISTFMPKGNLVFFFFWLFYLLSIKDHVWFVHIRSVKPYMSQEGHNGHFICGI